MRASWFGPGTFLAVIAAASSGALWLESDKDWGAETPYRRLARQAAETAGLDFPLGTNRIRGIVRNRKRVHINIANRKSLARVNCFHSAQPFAKSVRQSSVQRVEGGLGDVEGSFPHAEHLGEAAAVIGMFVGD